MVLEQAFLIIEAVEASMAADVMAYVEDSQLSLEEHSSGCE